MALDVGALDPENRVAPPAEGWIDIHSHILPGIDDGCRSLDESLNCVRQLKQRGFIGTVCTPHYWPRLFPDNIPEQIAEKTSLLRSALKRHGIEYQLWTGGEVRVDASTIEVFERFGVPTVGASKCVLCDHWGQTWPDFMNETFAWLKERGYQPILAHPERLDIEPIELPEVIARVKADGVWLQGNFNSISGGEGRTAEMLARAWLDSNDYHVLAMDMHRPDALPGRFKGVQVVEQERGLARLQLWLRDRPREILRHGLV